MRYPGRFGFALALCVALAVTAVAGTISRSTDNDGLDVAELIRVEPLPPRSASELDDHLRWMFEIFAGQRRWTAADLATRFVPEFSSGFTADGLNQDIDALFLDPGPVRFVRVNEREEDFLRAVGVAEDGTPMTAWITAVPDGRMETLGLDVSPAPPRLRHWEAAFALLTGWLLIVAAVAAARAGAEGLGFLSLVGSLTALASIVVLSNSETGYTIGRIVPAVLIPIGAFLLIGSHQGSRRTWAVGMASVAALATAVAPLTRDSARIGHPAVLGSFADDRSLYRGLLVASEGFAALAFAVIVIAAISWSRRSNRWRRPPLLVTAAIATVWALAAMGSLLDYIVGDGSWAGGPLTAATWSAMAGVPAVIMFRLVTSRWDRPELATLVIDLETDGSELQPAVSQALGDPSLQVLTSPDGQRLQDTHGDDVDRKHVPGGRAVSEIRSGSRLVGALIHDSVLKRDPERLQAVAAAAGLALEVGRLNEQVKAQLQEVNASRKRIVQANDDARRQLERDLHDGAQQRLVALGLDLQRARRQAEAGASPSALAVQLDDATAEVRDAVNEIRAVSKGARPALLAERGLTTAVEALITRSPVPVNTDLAIRRLPPEVETTVYYVIAEGLTNVAKHGNANSAEVSLNQTGGTVMVQISDDGEGGAIVSAGSGLEGLSDRVAAAGGTLSIASNPSGTTLKAVIPCE